ncbi:helix-turn-helix domain-containing protein [Pandoraea fibrosis]|uniref:Helix-turn-helix domain-containing protein n=1 Tax=Pandoraea fibrosis TaxID=1891094 RepID=A0ABX6HP30_9BURK|nr:XRE family transcriptional regulator [Pandoraea fibrosis]QHE91184.1 helix-turn-helix domain-containing protein [Pandoraea fibrosis]QHF12015.1 helix-turn-helix domain-containing protein [Pandoraea fibrosis]
MTSTTRKKSVSPGKLKRDSQVSHETVGARLRNARTANGLTLKALSERSGVAVSTISKAERGDIALTYDKFGALARALGLDYSAIFGHDNVELSAGISPSFTEAGKQAIYETPNYRYGMIASDLANKRMVPMRAHIRARKLEDFPDYIRHAGEEFVFVLSGNLLLQFENGSKFRLAPGDSLYFDSGVGHVYLSEHDDGVDAIVCCVDVNTPGPILR